MHEDTDTICRLAHVTDDDGRTLARFILDALEDEHGRTETSERIRRELEALDAEAVAQLGLDPDAA